MPGGGGSGRLQVHAVGGACPPQLLSCRLQWEPDQQDLRGPCLLGAWKLVGKVRIGRSD